MELSHLPFVTPLAEEGRYNLWDASKYKGLGLGDRCKLGHAWADALVDFMTEHEYQPLLAHIVHVMPQPLTAVETAFFSQIAARACGGTIPDLDDGFEDEDDDA